MEPPITSLPSGPYEIKDNKYKDKKEEKADHRKSKKYMEKAHIGHEWDSTKEGTSEEDEKVATIAIHKSSPYTKALQRHVR